MLKVARAIFAPFNIRSPGYTMNMDNSRSMRNFVFTVGLSYILIVSGDTGTLNNRKFVHCFNSCSGITVESEKVKSVPVTSCRVNRVSIIGKNPVRIFAVREKEPCSKWFTFWTHGNRKWCCSRTYRGHRQGLENIPSIVNFTHEKKLAAPMVIMPLKATNWKHFMCFDY